MALCSLFASPGCPPHPASQWAEEAQRLHLTFQLLEASLLLLLQQLPNSTRGTVLHRSKQLILYYRHQGHRVLGEEREPFPNSLSLSVRPELPNSTLNAALCRVQPADPAGAGRAALLTATPLRGSISVPSAALFLGLFFLLLFGSDSGFTSITYSPVAVPKQIKPFKVKGKEVQGALKQRMQIVSTLSLPLPPPPSPFASITKLQDMQLFLKGKF